MPNLDDCVHFMIMKLHELTYVHIILILGIVDLLRMVLMRQHQKNLTQFVVHSSGRL